MKALYTKCNDCKNTRVIIDLKRGICKPCSTKRYATRRIKMKISELNDLCDRLSKKLDAYTSITISRHSHLVGPENEYSFYCEIGKELHYFKTAQELKAHHP